MPSAGECVLGVDAGGTKTVAWLAPRDASQSLLGSGRAGPGNPSAVGIDRALAAIAQAVDAAFRAAKVPRGPLQAACLSVAGADRPAESSQIAAWANRQELASVVHLSNDAEPLIACTPDGWGVALIAGTGSFCLGRGPNGDIAKVGGWGFRIGDEGSGYALAIAGLRAAAQCADGRGARTSLLGTFQSHFGVTEARQLITALYAPDMDRRRIADLAPLVIAEARGGDEVARLLTAEAGSALAAMVLAVVTRLRLTGDCPLAATGGLIVNGAEVRDELLLRLAAAGSTVQLRIIEQPVEGAVELARRLAGPEVPDGLVE